MTSRPEKKLPIIEIFGPTVQGEGNMCGKQTHFIRSGGCDHKCKMCDSLHAVDPVQVKQNRTMMTTDEIIQSIRGLDKGAQCPWVTLSGGNPAMWDYSKVVAGLQEAGYKVAVETQGTLWKDWIGNCNLITVSPKSPGMGEETDWEVLEQFMYEAVNSGEEVCLKVVIFDEDDLEYAKVVWDKNSSLDLYLSLGNPWLPGNDITGDDHVLRLLDRYRSLAERLYHDDTLNKAIFLPQLHVLAWSNEMGR